MTLLPIADRELRLAARRAGTYRLRFFAALSGILLWLLILAAASRQTMPHEVAQITFVVINLIALTFALLSGVFFTADSLSSEKRDGTMGLLFLTDLRGYDVVIGKLAATSLHGIYGLLTIFPVLALPVLMGGVSMRQFEREIWVLLDTLFFSLSVGLLISALAREARQAFMATFLVLFVVAAVLPAMCALWDVSTRHGSFLWVPAWLCPYFSFKIALDGAGFTRSLSGNYSGSLAAMFFTGLACLVSACWMLPRVWQRAERSAVGPSRAPAFAGGPEGGSFTAGAKPPVFMSPRLAMGFAERARGLEMNPFFWLAGRDSKGWRSSRIAIRVMGIVWFIAFVMLFKSSSSDTAFVICFFGALLLPLVVKLVLAGEATRRFVEDRSSGALELVLGTPMPVEQVWKGQWEALRGQFRWPLFLSAVPAYLLIFVLDGPNPMRVPGEPALMMNLVLIACVVMLFTDSAALRWVGMEMGLRHRKHHRAILATLARVILPPWVAVVLFFIAGMGGGISNGGVNGAICIFAFGCGLHDSILASMARDRLAAEFRRMAAGDFLS